MKKIYIDDKGRVFEDEWADVFNHADSVIEEMRQKSDKMETKGGSKMSKLFKKTNSDKVVELDKRDGKIKRKAKVIGEVVSMSIKGTLNDSWTYAAGASVGLNQGLKYKGDFKAGTKAGLATVAVLAGVNVVGNIILNKEVIKEA